MDPQRPEATHATVLPFPHAASVHADRLMRRVLDNMSQGVLLNADTQLVVCNQRYAEMYKLPHDTVRPGRSLHELLSHRSEVGTFFRRKLRDLYRPDSPRASAKGKTVNRHDRAEPTAGSSPLVSKPVADGGWVTTHEDITARAGRRRPRSPIWRITTH